MKRSTSSAEIQPGWLMLLASPLTCLVFAAYELWERHPAYHFFPLPLVALIWMAAGAGRNASVSPQAFSAFKLLTWAHFAVALASFLLVSPFLAGVAFLVATMAFSCICGRGADDPPRWCFPALAVFFIPPPLMLDVDLHQQLAGLAARLSQGWLDAMQVLHVVEGTIVVTPERRFFVDDACSGTNSMLVAVCVALILCGLKRRSLSHALLLVLGAGLISVATNVLRICLVIGGLHFWGLELDRGLPHEALGVLVFMLDLLLVWSADNGLHFMLNQTPETAPPSRWGLIPARAVVSTGFRRPFSLLVACLGLLSLLGPELLSHSRPVAVIAADPVVDFTMPGKLAGWQRDGDKPLEDSVIGNLGVRNQVWLYRKDGLEAYVAVNFPFHGFHDTRLCYSGQGWQFEKQIDASLPGDKGNTVRFLQMNQPAGLAHANLWLSVLDSRGVAQTFASEDRIGRVTDRLLARWTDPEPVSSTYVLQVMAVEPGAEGKIQSPFTALLAGAREHLASAISNQEHPGTKEGE